jgi:hypothetical protein
MHLILIQIYIVSKHIQLRVGGGEDLVINQLLIVYTLCIHM